METAEGATDGAILRTYEKGETYTVSEDLAEAFEASGKAELVSDAEPAEGGPQPKGKK